MLSKLLKSLKQRFCKHTYVYDSAWMEFAPHNTTVIWYVCTKCNHAIERS